MTEAVDNIHRRLGDESAEIRRRAVIELAGREPDFSLPLLLDALGDGDWRVRREAAQVVSRLSDREGVVEALLSATEADENIGLRNAALHALSVAGEHAVTKVIGRLTHVRADVRKTAVDIVGLSRDPRAVDALRSALSDSDDNIRCTAAEWLGEYSETAAGEALVSCLETQNSLLRLVALQSMEKMGAKVAFTHLEGLLDDPLLDEVVVPILGASGSKEAVAEVAKRLAFQPAAAVAMVRLHREGKALSTAVESALSEVGRETHDAVWRFVENETGETQKAAVQCALWMRRQGDMERIITLAARRELYPLLVDGLSRWGETALSVLKASLGKETEHRLASVVGLLYRLLDESAGQAVRGSFEKLLDSNHPAVVTAAASAVARFSDSRVVPRLLTLIQSDAGRIRSAAGAALLELAERYPSEVLCQINQVPVEGKSGVQICRVLEQVGGSAEESAVSAAVDASDGELRRCAVRALAKLAGERAVFKVASALDDSELSVRMAAVEALSVIGPAAGNAIAAAIPSASGPVAPALIRALGRVGHPDAMTILEEACHRTGDVALAAIEAAEMLGIPREKMPIDLFEHPDKEVVKTALHLFGSVLPTDPLMDLIAHPEWDVRLEATKQINSNHAESETLMGRLRARTGTEDNDLVRDALTQAIQRGETKS